MNKPYSMNRGRKAAALLLSACLGLTACGIGEEGTVYHQFRSIPLEGWGKEDTLLFDVAVPDSQTDYLLTVEVRHTVEYSYRNLDLCLLHSACPADSTGRSPQEEADTLRLMLADEKGLWNGKGWGGLYQTAFPARNVSVTVRGTYRFRLIYNFSDTTLHGLSDIGIRLQRTQGATASHQHASPSGINAQEDEKQDGKSPQ